MPNVFVARYVPPTAPDVEPVKFPGITSMRWVGYDGNEWDLLSTESPVFLAKGVRGLAAPPHYTFEDSSPGSHGSRYRGHRALARPVQWNVVMYSDASSEKWVEHDDTFWRTMHPDRPGRWYVGVPGKSERSLELRFMDDGGHVIEEDPIKRGWDIYGVSLQADQPFWEGEPIVRRFNEVGVIPGFFAPPGSSHVFTIGPTSSVATATIDNPGDEPAYAKWVVEGPFDSAQVGVGDRIITIPFPIAAGMAVVLDSNPAEQSALEARVEGNGHELTGVDLTRNLGEADWAPIPSGAKVDLNLEVSGTGSVTASITPLYRRAW